MASCHFRLAMFGSGRIEGRGLPCLICRVQNPLGFVLVTGAETPLFACRVVLNEVVWAIFPLEHPICLFHVLCHVNQHTKNLRIPVKKQEASQRPSD